MNKTGMLYVLRFDKVSNSFEDGYVPLKILNTFKDGVKVEGFDDEVMTFKENNKKELIFQDELSIYYGVYDIERFYNERWKIRENERIEGMKDHIEKSYELKIVDSKGEHEYHEVFNTKDAEELILETDDIVYAAFIQQIRTWESEHPSEWEKGIMIEYQKDEIKRIKE